VTIPKAVRDRLGLSAGVVIEFRAEAGKLIGTKAAEEDVFKKWRGKGKLPRGLSVDAYLDETRGHDKARGAHRR
jgi:bifunctional DNA-binding transcriptional regulator/antitoxin component of YhaV-PrlF toxin-antitoxin module